MPKHSRTVYMLQKKGVRQLQNMVCLYYACQNVTVGVLSVLLGSSWNRFREIWTYLKVSLMHMQVMTMRPDLRCKGEYVFPEKMLL